MRHLFILSIILLFSTISFSQKSNENIEELYEKATQFIEDENYKGALPLFLKLDSISPDNANFCFNVGVCYINSLSEKLKAIPYLEKAIENVSVEYLGEYDKTTSPVYAFYYLGKAYHLENKIDSAIHNFKRFKYYLTPQQSAIIKDVDRQIEMCYTAKKMELNPVNIKIDNLGPSVNTQFPEYSPVISLDENTLFFTSRRSNSTGGLKDNQGNFYEDIYTAKLSHDKNSWIMYGKIGSNINTNAHEASVSVSADGKQLIIYREGDLYFSKLRTQEWSSPEKLPSEINTPSQESEACLSADGNTIYFVSNKSGGRGGTDIYFSQRISESKWSKPQNMGSPINTAGNEHTPVLLADNATLYFRSDGITKNENSDIFISTQNQGIWSTPKSVKMDEVKLDTDTMKMPEIGQKETYSSGTRRRFSYRDGDIFMSNFLVDEWSTPEKFPIDINTPSWEPHACLSPDGGIIYFVSDRPGGFGGRDIYKAIKLGDNKWSKAENLGSTINTEYDEDSPFILADGATMYFSSKGHESMGGFDIFTTTLSEKGFWATSENIGYPINTTDDDVFYVPMSDETHAYYSSAKLGGYGNQDIYKISIISAKKVLALLSGIVYDFDTKNPLEARVEIKDADTDEIIASLISDKKTGGYNVTLPYGRNYEISAITTNYISYFEKFTIVETVENKEIKKDIPLKKDSVAMKNVTFENKELEIGQHIVLNNIYFDFNKATLRPESNIELSKLLNFMKDNPTVKIELSGHTDNVGSAAYNKKLSDDRSRACVDFLVENGVEKTRLTFVGYGYDLPIATNKTEEGRQKNRRTEFKILSK